MATGSPIDRAARAIKKAGSTSPAWVQRTQQMSMHQGTLTRVDAYNGVADFQFPDQLIIPSVNYIRPYTDTNLPQVGHVVWGINNGTDFMIWGQHQVLNGLVSM